MSDPRVRSREPYTLWDSAREHVWLLICFGKYGRRARFIADDPGNTRARSTESIRVRLKVLRKKPLGLRILLAQVAETGDEDVSGTFADFLATVGYSIRDRHTLQDQRRLKRKLAEARADAEEWKALYEAERATTPQVKRVEARNDSALACGQGGTWAQVAAWLGRGRTN